MQLEILDFLATNLWLTLLLFGVIVLMMLFVFIKKYIMIFPPYEFYVHLRYGKVRKQGEGGMVVRIPFIDKVLVIDRTVQQLNIHSDSILSLEKQLVKVSCVLQWQAENASATINNVTWKEIPVRLTAIIESVTRTACAKLTVVQILEERQLIIEAIKKELVDIIAEWGLKVNTVEIIDVQVANPTFVSDLARPQQAVIARQARLAEIEKERTTETADIEKDRTVRIAEVEKDRIIGVQEQEQLRAIREAQKMKETSVQEIDLKRAVMNRDYEKKQAEIVAAQGLEVAKLNAEAEKQRILKEEVEVQAQRILQEANANAEGVRMKADAAAKRILLEGQAEADMKKAMLLAEADGLMQIAEATMKEREAHQKYSPQEFARDFLRMVPEAYAQMKIGNITTFAGMGGSGGEGSEGAGMHSPLEFMGNVLMPMMMMSKFMGFDFNLMMQEGLGEYATEGEIAELIEEVKKKIAAKAKKVEKAKAK